jgi:hypothetical protein
MTTSTISNQDAARCHQVPILGMAAKLTNKLLNDQLLKTRQKEKL